MQIGTATAEHFAETVCRRDQQHEQDHAQQGRALAQWRVTQKAVNEPANEQRAQADVHPLGATQAAARGQQVQRRVGVEHHAQQGHAGQPGRIGFPFEPVQILRHGRRRELVLLQVVDAATVDRPQITRQAFTRVAAVEVVLQPDEVERCADPGDADNHVNPAHAQIQPFHHMCQHGVYPSSGWGSRTSNWLSAK